MRVIFSASARCAGRRQEEGKVGHEALLAIPSCGDGEACRSADSARSSWVFGLVLIGKSGTIERLSGFSCCLLFVASKKCSQRYQMIIIVEVINHH